MPRQTPDLEVFEGVVSRTNNKGFQLNEYGADWFNVSQYADPMPSIPPVGAYVVCGVDSKGFVYTTEYDGQPAQGQNRRPGQGQQNRPGGQRPGGGQPAQSRQQPAQAAERAAAAQMAQPADSLPNDWRVRIMSAEIAVSFSAGRTDVKSTDVLRVAQLIEGYVRTGKIPDVRTQGQPPANRPAQQQPEQPPD